jgi:hypothetical protein
MLQQDITSLDHNPRILIALNIVHAFIASNTVENFDNLIATDKHKSDYYGQGDGYGVSAYFVDTQRQDNNEVVLSVTLNNGKFTSALYYYGDCEDIYCSNLEALTEKARQGLAEKHVINASIH